MKTYSKFDNKSSDVVSQHHVVPTATASYVVVPTSDVHIDSDNNNNIIPEAFASSIEYDLSRPAQSCSHVASNYTNLFPAANGLTWSDKFFDDNDDYIDDIIAVFDFDYDSMESYYTKLGWCLYGSSFLCQNVFWIATFLCLPCYISKNVQWNIRNQHVAITRHGIVFVHDKRPCCWGHSCSEIGKMSKTIPFDKITDCKLEEAAGTTCLLIDNTLDTITLKADKGQQAGVCEIFKLPGLKNPEGFRKLVLEMKNVYGGGAAAATRAVRLTEGMERAAAAAGASVMNAVGGTTTTNNNNADVATLLREIRDELRQNNQVLQSLNNNNLHPVVSNNNIVPSAPFGEFI